MANTNPDYAKFKKERSMLYLHDRCKLDQQVPHNARFYVTSSKNPWDSVIYQDRSMRKLVTTKNYLQRIWRRGAERSEAEANTQAHSLQSNGEKRNAA